MNNKTDSPSLSPEHRTEKVEGHSGRHVAAVTCQGHSDFSSSMPGTITMPSSYPTGRMICVNEDDAVIASSMAASNDAALLPGPAGGRSVGAQLAIGAASLGAGALAWGLVTGIATGAGSAAAEVSGCTVELIGDGLALGAGAIAGGRAATAVRLASRASSTLVRSSVRRSVSTFAAAAGTAAFAGTVLTVSLGSHVATIAGRAIYHGGAQIVSSVAGPRGQPRGGTSSAGEGSSQWARLSLTSPLVVFACEGVVLHTGTEVLLRTPQGLLPAVVIESDADECAVHADHSASVIDSGSLPCDGKTGSRSTPAVVYVMDMDIPEQGSDDSKIDGDDGGEGIKTGKGTSNRAQGQPREAHQAHMFMTAVSVEREKEDAPNSRVQLTKRVGAEPIVAAPRLSSRAAQMDDAWVLVPPLPPGM